jgi:hypothetical protein
MIWKRSRSRTFRHSTSAWWIALPMATRSVCERPLITSMIKATPLEEPPYASSSQWQDRLKILSARLILSSQNFGSSSSFFFRLRKSFLQANESSRNSRGNRCATSHRAPDNPHKLPELGRFKTWPSVGWKLGRRKRAEVSASDEMSALLGNELAA